MDWGSSFASGPCRVAVAFLVFGVGCSDPLTQVVVVVDTDLSAPSELDKIRFEVTGPQGARDPIEQRLAQAGGPLFPLSLTLVPKSPGEIALRVAGELDGDEVVAQQRVFTPRQGESQSVHIFLGRSCAGRMDDCSAASTCSEGDCVSSAVEPGPWPLDGGTATPDSGEDAGADTGGFDAEPPTDAPGVDAPGVDAPGVDAPGVDAPGVDAGPMCPGGCDDGDPCTFDVCTDEGCAFPDTGECECQVDGDCPGDQTGNWGNCDYSDDCDQDAIRSRSLTTYECMDRQCVRMRSDETEPCSRDTGGLTCVESSGTWTPCYVGSPPEECQAVEGMRERWVSSGTCNDGTCAEVTRTREAESCSPNTEDWPCEGCVFSTCSCDRFFGCEIATASREISGRTSAGSIITVACGFGGGSCSGRVSGGENTACQILCGPGTTRVTVTCRSEDNAVAVQHQSSSGWSTMCSSNVDAQGVHVAMCQIDLGFGSSPQSVRCLSQDG